MKKTFLILMMIMSIFLQGCIDVKLDVGQSIVPPKNKRIPVGGTWKVEKYKIVDEKVQQAQVNEWIGKTAIFHEHYAVFADEISEAPEYKMKNVDAKEYFLYTHKISEKELNVQNKRIEIISISSKEKHFYDFIKIDEHRLIVYIDHVFYYLEKVSDTTNQIFVKDKNKINRDNIDLQTKEPDILSSGVLIGLRKDVLDPTKENEVYRTLWIAAQNRKMHSILEMPHLIVPRKSGFWMIGENRKFYDDKVRDQLFSIPLEKTEEPPYDEEEDINQDIYRKIKFVGNDYVALEYQNDTKKFQVLLIDHIQGSKGIKLSDVVGEHGKEVYTQSAQSYLNFSWKPKEHYEMNEENFSLARRNGHWILKGKINTKKDESLEFNINMFPPYKMVHYDELHVSWNEIKGRVPEAIDAYTSPNKDFAVIITNEEIYVYMIENKTLALKPTEKIKLQEGEKVVMAEWATASYVEKWENTFPSK
ncbi:hypothetical protein [Inediibacterium massiliense]|uniref:hypothetical protein n=1 Tax=Inediibacterium massiliense TaxID=1658111 RepID=UPI0006B4A0ED|nr:hypothetical protein [Inediibacterium massiliense]